MSVTTPHGTRAAAGADSSISTRPDSGPCIMEEAATELPLPDDALAAVLACLPARSLAASRCVCKAWRALIDARGLLLPHVLPHEVCGPSSSTTTTTAARASSLAPHQRPPRSVVTSAVAPSSTTATVSCSSMTITTGNTLSSTPRRDGGIACPR